MMQNILHVVEMLWHLGKKLIWIF